MTDLFHSSFSVWMRRTACCCLLALTGCVSSNMSVDRAVGSLRAGNDPQALQWAEGLKHSIYGKELGYVETGRVRMLSGDFQGSSTNFSAAIDTVIEKTENGPVIKVGDVGANVMAGTVTDDRTRPYRLPAYEFIQALQYQMMNDLFLGQREAAAVEARRAVFAQDQLADKYGKEVADARASSETSNTAAMGQIDARMKNMAPVIEMTRSSYENGLAWYFCGVLFEQNNDQADAALSYRKAWELTPGNPYVQNDFLRLLRTQDTETFKRLAKQAGVNPASLVRSPTEIILIAEEGFVPQRRSVKIPLPIPGINTLTSVDFPLYMEAGYSPMALEIRENDKSLGMSALALSMQSLAYRDLKEKIPGIAVRNITRVATRAAAQYAANTTGNDYAKYGVLAFNAVSALVNKADTRAWYTLPMVAHLYRGAVTPGAHTLELRNQANGFVTRVPVNVAAGETRLVWIADLGGNARAATASLNGKGAPATFMVCGSLQSGYPPVSLPGGPRTLCGMEGR